MAQPVYLGTVQEVLGDGCAYGPVLFENPEVPGWFSARKEYWLVPPAPKDDGSHLLLPNTISWRVPDIREAVRAPKGRKIFSADYSQIEVKIMAWLSQDPFLIAAIRSGKDIHSYMASEIFGIPYEDFHFAVKNKSAPKHKEYSKIRSSTKTTTFGVPYGAGAKRVAMMTGMSEEDAQSFIDQYFAKARVLKEYLDALRKEAVQNRCSRSPRGRVRWYDVPPRRDPNYRKVIAQIERYAGNHPIQAGCVDLLKPAMAYFYLALRNGIWNGDRIYPHAALLLAVHDELVGECLEEHAGSTENPGPVPLLLKASMERSYNELTTHIKSRDEDGSLHRKEICIRDIPNRVDVVVNDFWSKD
jgi:DNA polymerase I-like protein with 3'-5' exonuclease and polymerase domains